MKTGTHMKKKNRTQDIAVITGAAAGIGREMVTLLMKQGIYVVALDMNREGLQLLPCTSYTVNVADAAELFQITEKIVKESGKPTIWINNAGITALGAFEDVSVEDFNRVIAVNFQGVVNGTRAALSVMKEPKRGTIVNMASVAGIAPAPFMSAYVASKHAVVGFTRSLRQELELSHSPIQMILVAPGFVKTKIMDAQGGFRFPDFLQFMVSNPETAAREIVDGILKGQAEIHPTPSGKLFIKMHRLMPGLLSRSSRLMVAKNWKELFGFTRINKR